MNDRRAPILIFTYGNPSRGDDALGPAMFDLLVEQQENGNLDGVELQTDFQLQIEHAMDLEGRKKILFVDASVSCAAPFECQPLQARQDDSFTTHAMSPSSVLAVYKQINDHQPPPAWLLTIRGYEFGLGLDMSEQAMDNMKQAYQYILQNYCK